MARKLPETIYSSTLQKYPRRFGKRERELAESILQDKGVRLTFECAPVISAVDQSSGLLLPAEAAAADVIGMMCDGQHMEYYHAVVESTGTAAYSLPKHSADGLEVPLDADVTDGVTAAELNFGITSRSKLAFTVGTDDAFYLEATIKIDDISALEEMFVGFRKAEAYQADPDSYDEMAAIHIGETGATVADGQINIATILNNAATSYTDTTLTDWADGNEKTLRVEVSKTGVCKFYVDGSEPTVTAAFTFDDGEVLVPFIYVDNTVGSTTGDPGVSISAINCGILR